MRIYDISLDISPDLPVWPGDPTIKLERLEDMTKGAHSNVSLYSGSVHAGTHVDAPAHFIQGGATVDQLTLKLLTGRAYVVDLTKADVISDAVLERAGLPPRTRRVLFKTRNSEYWARGEKQFAKDYVAVDASGARWLVRKGVQLVGVDYLSVAPFEDTLTTHRALLEAGVVVVEGLNLHEVSQGRYALYCLPLKLLGSEGAPARVILVGV